MVIKIRCEVHNCAYNDDGHCAAHDIDVNAEGYCETSDEKADLGPLYDREEDTW